jgi:hypothetical protein
LPPSRHRRRIAAVASPPSHLVVTTLVVVVTTFIAALVATAVAAVAAASWTPWLKSTPVMENTSIGGRETQRNYVFFLRPGTFGPLDSNSKNGTFLGAGKVCFLCFYASKFVPLDKKVAGKLAVLPHR